MPYAFGGYLRLPEGSAWLTNSTKGEAMATMMKWARTFPHSANNFDLVLANPQTLDSNEMSRLLSRVLEETHGGLSLSSRATAEFGLRFDHPDTPLKSEAYVLLSNWFMTQSGDRKAFASRCEDLWDRSSRAAQ
jgi:hypothetical protein